MDTKAYLSQLKNLNNRIKDCLKEAERWYDIATSTSSADYSSPKVQVSPNPDRIGDVVGKVVDYQRMCIEQADEYTILRRTIIEQIKGMKGEDGELYYNLLYGYYVDGKSFSKLVVDESYSYRQIKRYFNEALKEFERMYGNQYLDAV